MALSIDAVESDSGSSAGTANRGEAAWHARRQAWCNPSNPQTSTTPPEVTNMLLNIQSRDHLRHIYKSLIIDRRGFNHPVPLGFAVRVCVEGWKADGTWPEGMEAPPPDDDNF
ncbi:hypothetical protein BCR43DRAFT_523636 [Syncephalastrum racemosum]|uniref:Gag1-like clamp domain-containing protein n=1 Tax=Syncephalastrum racemosum TaxID=13706 RepID=A0A1X2HG60_SYNRA|nr:hypothetical protein BCR43DRAFT_523636 [Syncephalastrum racemosum]